MLIRFVLLEMNRYQYRPPGVNLILGSIVEVDSSNFTCKTFVNRQRLATPHSQVTRGGQGSDTTPVTDTSAFYRYAFLYQQKSR